MDLVPTHSEAYILEGLAINHCVIEVNIAEWNELSKHVKCTVSSLADSNSLILAPDILANVPIWERSYFPCSEYVLVRGLHEWISLDSSELLIDLQSCVLCHPIIDLIPISNDNQVSKNLFSRSNIYLLHLTFCITNKLEIFETWEIPDFNPIIFMQILDHLVNFTSKYLFDRRTLIT